MMNNESNIIGCFVSTNMEDVQGDSFRTYIWGIKGVCESLKELKHENYGKDMKMILFQFYVNPIPFELENLKEIENYRKKEKAIGIPVIINEDNFFSKSEVKRFDFIKTSILQKLDLLEGAIKKKKLDTDIELLKVDFHKIFDS